METPPPKAPAAAEPGAAPPARPRLNLAEILGLALLLGLLLLSGIGRWVIAPPLWLIAALTVLPWLWLGGAAALVVGAVLSRSRRLAAAALLAGVVFVGVWVRAWAAWPDRCGDGVPLRVMEWNVQRLGWEDAEESPRLDCVSAEILRQDPDVLALLEVTTRDVQRLSARLDLQCVQVDYRGTGSAKRGGLAACARGSRWRLGENHSRRFTEDIDWYYVFAEMLPLSAGPDSPVFNLVTVHLQPHGLRPGPPTEVVSDHNRETRALLDRMGRLQDPTVLAGDFNSARDAAVHVRLRRSLVDSWEQAGWGPGATVLVGGLLPLRIDYVYATPSFGVERAFIPDVDCSDHRPVVSDLRLRPAAD